MVNSQSIFKLYHLVWLISFVAKAGAKSENSVERETQDIPLGLLKLVKTMDTTVLILCFFYVLPRLFDVCARRAIVADNMEKELHTFGQASK